MPLVKQSTYKPPPFFKNSHIQTIYPSLFRKVNGIDYLRERIDTPDGDFIDLDWSRVSSEKAVIVSHGLEGDSQRHYMRGIIKAFNKRGWDGIAFNYRGCSGEPNKLLRSYHSGATEDLHTVICHVLEQNRYTKLALVGFSLGGNLTIKYIGERGSALSPFIQVAAAISVPCDLASSASRLSEKSNTIYTKRFIRLLKKKVKSKMQIMPGKINYDNFKTIKSLKDFDDLYTAPIHGFVNAEDYWSKCSCKQFISNITIPTLLINASDDPFLSKECYPLKESQKSEYFFLEMPKGGGHVGFVTFNSEGEYWHETRVTSFVKSFHH